MTPRTKEAAPVESAVVESGRRVPPVGELLAALAGEDGADGQATDDVEEDATGEGGEEA